MASSNLSALVAAAWEHAQLTTEAPDWFVRQKRTYRECLDRQRRNYKGDVIPRIETVRNNIARLGKPKPKLPG